MLAPRSLQIRHKHPKPIWVVFHMSKSFIAALAENAAYSPRAGCLAVIMVRGPLAAFIAGVIAPTGGTSAPLFEKHFLPFLNGYTVIPFKI